MTPLKLEEELSKFTQIHTLENQTNKIVSLKQVNKLELCTTTQQSVTRTILTKGENSNWFPQVSTYLKVRNSRLNNLVITL